MSDAVMPHGQLNVTPIPQPSHIMVAGQWQVFHQLTLHASDEPALVTSLELGVQGDSASFDLVGVMLDDERAPATDARILASAGLPSGIDRHVRLNLVAHPITVPKNGTVTLDVVGRLNYIVSSTTVPPSVASGYARSGAVVTLGVTHGLTADDWGSDYAGAWNISAMGLFSGQREYVAAPVDAELGTSMVIRRSRPFISPAGPATGPLASGVDQDLYRFVISSDQAGPVSLKKVTFHLHFNRGADSNLGLTSLALRRGASDLPSSEYHLIDQDGHDVPRALSNSMPDQWFSVVFTSEQTIQTTEALYTLHGMVSGTLSPGDSIQTGFAPQAISTNGSTYLSDSSMSLPLHGINVPGPQFELNVPGHVDTAGTFIWSDLSEVPHVAQSRATGGSHDWINDWGLVNLEQTQTLTR